MERIAGDLDTRLERIEAALDDLRTRLSAVEAGRPAPLAVEPPPSVAPEGAPLVPDDEELRHPMALIGRSVLILGGAFVLRALTDSGVLPLLAGVTAGLAYAIFWIVIADRAARDGRPGEALFDCVTAAAIAYPLMWEASTRFAAIHVAAATALVLGVALLFLWVAARHSLSAVGWIASAGASATFVAIAIGTRDLPWIVAMATIVAAAALLVSDRIEAPFLAWPAIATSDLLALALLGLALIRRGAYSPTEVVLALAVFAAVWFAVVIGRCLNRRMEPMLVEIAQLVEVGLLGVAATLMTVRLLGAPVGPTATLAVTAGLVLFCASAVALRRELKDLAFLTSGIGSFVLLAGSWFLLGTTAASITWALVAVVAAALVPRLAPPMPAVHTAIWLVAATLASGLPFAAMRGLAATTGEPGIAALATSVLAAVAWTFLRHATGARAVRALAIAVFVTGFVAAAMAPIVSAGASAGHGVLAVTGTAMLSVIAALLALGGRMGWVEEGSIVASGLLVVAGAKLMLHDLRGSSAALLVVAFAIYGVAMLIVSRSGRATTSRKAAAPSHSIEQPL